MTNVHRYVIVLASVILFATQSIAEGRADEFDDHFQAAIKAITSHNRELANTELAHCVRINSEDARCSMLRSMQVATIDFPAAIREATRATEIAPENEVVWRFRGMLFEKHGDLERAFSDYMEVRLLCPNVIAFSDCARILTKMGNFEAAIEPANSAVKLSSDELLPHTLGARSLIYVKLSLPEKSLSDLNEAIKLAKPQQAVLFCLRGNTFSKLGRYDEAIEDFSKALSLEPNNFDAFDGRAEAYLNNGNLEKQQADLETSRAIQARQKPKQ